MVTSPSWSQGNSTLRGNRVATRPVIIQRYGRSWLLDTSTKCFLTVEELRQRRDTFQVIDVETGDDITRVLLA